MGVPVDSVRDFPVRTVEGGFGQMPFCVIVQLDDRVFVRIVHPVIFFVQVPDFKRVPTVSLILAFDDGISVLP